MILDELLAIAPRRPRRHDRHRRALPRDARDLARVRGALRRARSRSRRRSATPPWTRARALLRRRRRSPRCDRALGRRRRVDHRPAPRAGTDARRRPSCVECDEKRGGIAKYIPLAHWTERDLWTRIHERDLPYHPLHDAGYESIGCAPCTHPGSGREGRWAGTDKTECGLHV